MDDYSRYNWVIFLKNKSETFSKFFNWYKQINNIFDKKIKFIKSDNGTEFTSKNFQNFCTDNGTYTYFLPHTHHNKMGE